MEADSNPRDLGRLEEVSYRPRAMVTGPMGRVWIASVPDYGLWGGPLSWFDPGTEAFGTYRDITPLYEKKDAFQIPGPVMGNSVYFAKKHEMKRLVI